MKISTQIIFQKLESMVEIMNNMDEKLSSKIENIENKVCELQHQVQSMGSGGGAGNAAYIDIENKEEYLNKTKPCMEFEGGLSKFIYKVASERHTDDEMMNILYESNSLMEYITDVIIYIIDEKCNNNMKFLHAFKSKRYNMYIWNENDCAGWGKATTGDLKTVFDVIQRSLIDHYTNYISSKHESPDFSHDKLMEIMEKASVLYDADFNKKFERDFKKALFNGMCGLNH
jgi:hypothetical protein